MTPTGTPSRRPTGRSSSNQMVCHSTEAANPSAGIRCTRRRLVSTREASLPRPPSYTPTRSGCTLPLRNCSTGMSTSVSVATVLNHAPLNEACVRTGRHSGISAVTSTPRVRNARVLRGVSYSATKRSTRNGVGSSTGGRPAGNAVARYWGTAIPSGTRVVPNAPTVRSANAETVPLAPRIVQSMPISDFAARAEDSASLRGSTTRVVKSTSRSAGVVG